ncbi:MAG TPA: nucleoside deaminase [Nocardioides sp.]|nr:nucleoside deaminase [Nocardioides sp.]
MTDERWLEEAVALATANVAGGGGPFGAVVVRGEVVVGRGQNRVTRDLDPTAHAEVVALRGAAREIADFSLAGCVLYSSCEPCPMCMSSALWARVDRVVYAADRADATRGRFADSLFYDLFSRPRDTWPIPVVNERVASAAEPFDAWLAREDRTPY